MTRKFRRFIFLIFIVFFVISSIIVILFAQGYRFDFNSLKIVKTGGIFIKTSTDGAKIYINDKYVKSTSGILNYSVLISGLAPKNYNVFVYKENYYPWNKTVEVKNGMVAELNSIILFPLELKKIKIAELPSRLIATSSEEFVSPDKNKKLYLSNNQLGIEYLKDIRREPAKSAGEKELIAAYESPVIFFDWLSDSEHLIWLANGELTVAELDNRGGKRNSIKFYLNIDSPVFWDRDNSDFYFFEKNILYKIKF